MEAEAFALLGSNNARAEHLLKDNVVSANFRLSVIMNCPTR